MKTLRKGDQGISVLSWETFLTGQGYYAVVVDGVFDESTVAATMAFQRGQGLTADGVVGPRTYAAALNLGYPGVDDAAVDEASPNWPSKPSGVAPLNQPGREALFGKFAYVPAPSQANPEGIRITDGWASENIVQVEIPQLVDVRGANGKVAFHAKAAGQLQALWQAWDDADLLDLVLSWEGSWVPRFIRGSRTVLSNHAWGTAFDVNAAWNPLGAVPALVGRRGSVRKLVELANEHGFYWGGWFSGRPDGMHFEVARIL
jgi:hypothetical protein